MIINIPTKYWIFLTIFMSCLSVVVLAGAGAFLFGEDILDEIDLGGSSSTPTVVANVPAQSRPGPTIDLSSLPIEAELERIVPLRIRVTDTIAGVRAVEVYINGDLVQAPQLLEGQQTALINFGYIPTDLNDFTVLVRAVANDDNDDPRDDRVSEALHSIEVIQPLPDAPDAVEGFDLPIAANDDPFQLALEFGVCPTQLVQFNPTLASIEPGDNLFIPTAGSNLNPTTYEACAGQGLDTIDVINFFNNPLLGIRRTFLAELYPIDPRYAVTPGRAFECSSFFTGVDGSTRGCPPDKPNFHTGIDIGAPNGTDLYSVSPGIVTWAGSFKDWLFSIDGRDYTDECFKFAGSEEPHEGYGNMVIIQTTINGVRYEFFYAHLSVMLVEIGQQVEGPGFVIGRVGSTGCSTAPHLHFEVREQGSVIDPIEFLEEQTEAATTG